MIKTAKNFLITLNNLQKMHLKLLSKEATGGFIGDKIANRITKVSRSSQKNNSETITNEHDNEIPDKRYTSS